MGWPRNLDLDRALALGVLILSACGSDTAVLDLGPMIEDAGGSSRDAEIGLDAGGVLIGRVILSTDTLDFGPVVVTSRASKTVTIANPGSDRVRVTLSETAGPDSARFSRVLNLPTESGTFVVEPFGAVTMTVSVAPEALGALLAVIALDSCQGTCPSAIVLTAIGVETGIVCPEEIDLGVANPGTCTSGRVTCENRGNATERITAVELEPTSSTDLALREPALPVVIAPGETSSFEVTFCPTVASGSAGDLVIFTFEPFETEHKVHIVGRGGGADVRCAPESVAFGTIGIGASVSRSIVCTNRGVEDAELTGVLTGAGGFSIREAPLGPVPPGASGAFVIEAAPALEGGANGTLRISTNDPDTPLFEVPLSLTAIRADPCSAMISPSSRDFGLVGIGDARRALLIVENTGPSVCLVRSIELGPGSSSAFVLGSEVPVPGAEIRSGASASIEITFTPTTNAVAVGTLLVSFSNPGTTELMSTLTGVGGATPIAAAPSVVDFGRVPLDCARPFTKTISLRRVLAGSGAITSIDLAAGSNAAFGLARTSSLAVTLGFLDALDFDVVFAPVALGAHSGEVRIFAGGQPSPMIIPVVAEGVSLGAATDRFTFASPTIDILFVVDDAPTMGAAQASLGEAIVDWAQAMVRRNVDFHVGVITTDMIDPTKSGRLIGSPSFFDRTRTSLSSDLALRIAPGIDGNGDRQGIAAAVTALSPSLGATHNAGFLRPGADLAIIFVADEDDASPLAPSIGERVVELRSRAGSGRLFLAGILGPPSGFCSGANGIARPPLRYGELVLRGSGRLLSFCDEMSHNLRVIAGDLFGTPSFDLEREPRYSTLSVSVDGAPVPRAASSADPRIWDYDAREQRLIFLEESRVPNGAAVVVTYDPLCASPACGNGSLDPNEDCDDGNVSDADLCTTACMGARCGDGIVRAASESCDDGDLDDRDGCLSTCVAAMCGDGLVAVGQEECDDGNTASGDGCPATCRFYLATGAVSEPFTPLSNPTPLVFAGAGDPADDGTATIPLPFAFPYYDIVSSTLTVSVNGIVGVAGIPEAESYVNATFPSRAEPNGILAPWWEDLYLDPGISGALVGYEIRGAPPERSAVIEWRGVRVQDHGTFNHRRFTFQVAIAETTGEVRFHFGDTVTTGNPPSVTSASVGIEDRAGRRGLDPLGCSPDCEGRPRSAQAPAGFPRQSTITFTP